MRILFALTIACCLNQGIFSQPVTVPEVKISNGLIQARLYLPDPINGYYRGARFDWSGVIPELVYNGHSYFGKWFEGYSPTMHDAIMGPVEDFQPVGYDSAAVGANFLKLGIGVVQKAGQEPYSIATPYRIVNAGKWQVNASADQVEFIHSLNDQDWSYEYNKTVKLVSGKPELVLAHHLKNRGKQAIETTVYNHNFFMIDHQLIGPDYTVQFPFNLIAETSRPGDIGRITEGLIEFLRGLGAQDHLYYGNLKGYGETATDYDIRIENTKVGAGVRITSDQPLSKLAFWSAEKTVCPEPFTRVKVKPGETLSWNIYYQFYSLK
jgi:hypothetical protein